MSPKNTANPITITDNVANMRALIERVDLMLKANERPTPTTALLGKLDEYHDTVADHLDTIGKYIDNLRTDAAITKHWWGTQNTLTGEEIPHTAGDAYRFVRDALQKEGTPDNPFIDEYFTLDLNSMMLIPSYKWVAVYAVRGGSEGWYIHVDLLGVTKQTDRLLLFIGKTLLSSEKAEQYVVALNRIMELL